MNSRDYKHAVSHPSHLVLLTFYMTAATVPAPQSRLSAKVLISRYI